MNTVELRKILDDHKVWVESFRKRGSCADLCSAALRDADLRDANLRGAAIGGANLLGADHYRVREALADGVPVGAQFVARRRREDLLLAVAAQLDRHPRDRAK